MATNCTVVQFLEPDEATLVPVGAEDHSLPVEEGGVLHLVIGQTIYDVAFVQQKLLDDYDFLEADVTNEVDVNPLVLSWMFTARDKDGFTVEFDGVPDTTNFYFNWRVRIGPMPL